ncbi:MAG TPA: hypothetical protein VL486_07180 [Verrucomicrobiae bacterium]|nr:hypothetical protein [Verrucomicrobiae bacterium]
MKISFRCPHCHRELGFDDLSQDESPCPLCGEAVKLHITERMRRDNVVDRCAVCDCQKVYVQKDFNRTLGVTIFAAGALLFLLCAWKNRLVEGTLVWAVFVIADALLYKFLPDVTICYKCYAQYREVSSNPDNQPFELGLAEKYDPLDKRDAAENPAAEWKGR